MGDSAHPVSEPGLDIPDHAGLVPDEIHDLIRRAHWQTAKSLEHVPAGRHQYNVIGWTKDDLTEEEFWFFAQTIKEVGREEEWTPPEGFYDDPRKQRRKMVNHYLYVGEYAYWFTRPRVPMLNREHVSVQQATPTRRVVER
jgi:hypothetical protein